MPQKKPKKKAPAPAKRKKADAKTPQPTGLQQFLRHSRVRATARFLLVWGAAWLILASSYLSTVLKNQNFLELFPHEMYFPLLQHALTALLVAAVLYRVRRPSMVVSKLVIAVLLALVMNNYDERLQAVDGLLRTLAPTLPPGNELPAVSLLLLVLFFASAVWLGRLFERWFTRQTKIESGNMVGGVMVLALFVFGSQAIRVWRILPSLQKQSATVAPELPRPTGEPTEKPDIYYIVFDRYASDQVLKEQFAYDNSGFTEDLKMQGFHVTDGARSNYPYTAQSVASTLNAGYLNEQTKPFAGDAVHSRTLYHNLIYQSSVIKALKQNGYSYHHIGNWYGASNNAPLADTDLIFEHNVSLFGREVRRLSGLEAGAFKQSPFYRFATVKGISWWPFKTVERYGAEMPRAQLAELNALSTQKSDQPRFIFAHILLPHDPFYFNADGSLSSTIGNDDIGKPVKQKYLEQVQFVNAQVRQTIASILQTTEGKAVILMNPDEGPHPNVMESSYIAPPGQQLPSVDVDMREWQPQWLRMKYGILQAVHIPQATPEDYEQLSSVNLFRIVLNRYLGYSLPYLPNCNYGLTKGAQHEFAYTDITEIFTGVPKPECAQFNSPG